MNKMKMKIQIKINKIIIIYHQMSQYLQIEENHSVSNLMILIKIKQMIIIKIILIIIIRLKMK